MSWHTLLILGGIGSGRSEYAESLVTGAEGLRRVPTGGGEAGLAGLTRLLGEAKPDETLLVDGLDGWLAKAGDPPEAAAALAAAVRDCPARLVLVSPEVGLAAPSTAANRTLAGALGALNHAVAGATDAVVLVVAGQPSWLKGTAQAAPATTAPAAPDGPVPELANLKTLPLPDEDARSAATDRLATLGTASLGALAAVVIAAAGGQGTAAPAPWRRVRVLVLLGDHAGAAAAGAPGSAGRAAQLRDGSSALAQLAAPAGAAVQIVETATAAAIEQGPAMAEEEVEPALAYGWRLARQAADEGVDALVLGAIGDGAETAAAAVTAALTPSTDAAGLLARVRTGEGTIDDQAWMQRCAAIRDAVHRARSASRTGGRAVLADLGGPDLATATGVLLGAAARRTPVLIDGPVGAAAGLVARNLAAQARHWCLLPDHGRHPTVVRAAEVLGLTPLLDLQLELGEGATALAALPLLNHALTLANTLATAPAGTKSASRTGA